MLWQWQSLVVIRWLCFVFVCFLLVVTSFMTLTRAALWGSWTLLDVFAIIVIMMKNFCTESPWCVSRSHADCSSRPRLLRPLFFIDRFNKIVNYWITLPEHCTILLLVWSIFQISLVFLLSGWIVLNPSRYSKSAFCADEGRDDVSVLQHHHHHHHTRFVTSRCHALYCTLSFLNYLNIPWLFNSKWSNCVKEEVWLVLTIIILWTPASRAGRIQTRFSTNMFSDEALVLQQR